MTVSLYWPHTGPDGCSWGAWLICGKTRDSPVSANVWKDAVAPEAQCTNNTRIKSSKAPNQHTSWKNGPLYGGCFGAAVQVFYTTVVFPVIKTLTYFQSAGKQPNLQALEVHYHIPGCTSQRRPWLKLIWSEVDLATTSSHSLPPSLPPG